MQKKIVKREFIFFFLERGIKTPDGTSGGQVLVVAAKMHADAKLLRLCLVVKQSEEESWSLATWKYFQGEEYQSGNLGEWGKNKQTDRQMQKLIVREGSFSLLDTRPLTIHTRGLDSCFCLEVANNQGRTLFPDLLEFCKQN